MLEVLLREECGWKKCVISSFLSFHGIIKLDVFRCFGATYFSLKKTNVNAYLKKDKRKYISLQIQISKYVIHGRIFLKAVLLKVLNKKIRNNAQGLEVNSMIFILS